MASAKPAASPEGVGTPPARGLIALWLGVAALVLLLDQWSKQLILRHYELGEGTVVTPFFNIVRAHNTGAAFSFLASPLVFMVVAIACGWVASRVPTETLRSWA